MCCLNYKGKEVEGRELKLHRLTADKKLRRVRWSPLSETGQKSDGMTAREHPPTHAQPQPPRKPSNYKSTEQ